MTMMWGCTWGSNGVGRHHRTTSKSHEEWFKLGRHLSKVEWLWGIAGERGSGRRSKACPAGLRLNYVLVEVEGVSGDAQGVGRGLYL